MSSSAATDVAVAPWRRLFLSHISKMDSPEFVFSTLSLADPNESATPYVPRARYCIFRGMWGELPANSYNDAPKNERNYQSDLPTLTTDVRMHKIPEIFASSAGHEDSSQTESQGCDGGGAVEAVFWVKEAMTQWRFRGKAYVVGPGIEGPGEDPIGVRMVKREIGKRMKVIKEAGRESWSWATELTAHFGNLSPTMRGTFKNPAPGSPMSLPPTDKSLRLGQQVSDLEDPVARKNFRVVIIKPDEVERVDLSNPERVQRWKFTYVSPKSGPLDQRREGVGEWKTEELWP
ncbi:Uncharacterized protein BP5553_10050 [Venustampulla echinocandica]|uniref:Pyridoxamine 5'-phosphate oxidase Alr4036 family FMN-binding domain-containing protein n=1 Tax=Venustampulla echinocandica TaxID=2656787 RepID=A0A370TA78_9HELO|nr:Uncharacterized protein BP5553_10050 [Venustampulla echinocandica]RDL30705.1 Uncharacterized protein BP5553_10050 [Venustampulla echinocandica]